MKPPGRGKGPVSRLRGMLAYLMQAESESEFNSDSRACRRARATVPAWQCPGPATAGAGWPLAAVTVAAAGAGQRPGRGYHRVIGGRGCRANLALWRSR
jgi:hypothetical protein